MAAAVDSVMTRQPITVELNEGAMTLLESLAAKAGQSPDHYGALLLEMAIAQTAMTERYVEQQQQARDGMLDAVDDRLRYLGVLR